MDEVKYPKKVEPKQQKIYIIVRPIDSLFHSESKINSVGVFYEKNNMIFTISFL